MLNRHTSSTLLHRWLALVLFLTPAGLLAQGAASPLRDAVVRSGGRVIVMLRSSNPGAALRARGAPPVPATELESISQRLRTRLQLRERSRAAAFGMVMGDIDPDQVAALLADSNVVAVEADRLWAPTDLGDEFTSSDPWAAYRRREPADAIPYGVTNVTAPTVWATGNHGEGTNVAVLDSGGDPTHPDLSYAGGYDATGVFGGGTDWSDNVAVCNGHGTHVAGTIAGLDNGSGVVGVAPRVRLYAIKVFQDVSGSCLAYTSAQINGLNWAVSQGIRLVNVSIGGSFSSAYESAIQTAASQGTYLIAAAGNNGGALTYPGSSQYAIGVGAVDGNNTRASWSDIGPELDFVAPGVGIYSTMPGGGYGTKSGTSMATPHVVGVSALILSAFPSLTFGQLYQKLRDGALDLEAAGIDNNTGYGLVRAANSIGGVALPLTLAVSPSSRSASVVQGGAAPGANATVTLSGDNSTTTAWSATKRKAWTTLTTGLGTGSGTVTWTRNATGLAVGTYVDTISVTATGATGSPARVIDTLRVTAAPVPLALAVSPGSRSASVVQGGAAPGSNATVTLSGDNSTTTVWSATKRKAWTTLTTGLGTGSGTVTWSRNATGLAVGTYVDTISVTATGATGSPARVIDTLRVTAAPVPLGLAVSPGSRNASIVQGGAAPGSNATVTLSGDNSTTTVWSASKRKAWTTLTTASGTGSGTVTWTRNATGLAVGTYVDTISVTATGATGSPARVIDTLRVTAAPVPLALAVSPGSRSASVVQGGAAPGSNATVTLSGDNSTTTVWSASKRKAWTTLTTASGTGSGTVTWTRNATGLAVGTYVDTISVTATGATGSPARVIDTLRVTAAPVPLALAVSPVHRTASVMQGGAAPGDNATVTLSGDNSTTTVWSASKRKAWTTLTAASGTGSGTVTWTRNATGLAVGTYVDTISVTATGATGSPGRVIDTLRVTAAPVPLALAVSPGSRTASVVQGGAAPGSNATVTLSGDNSTTTVWSATKRKAWTTLTTGLGTGSGTVTWTRNATGLAVGTYVDTISVTATGATGSPARVIDTLRVTAAPVPLALAVSPGSRSASVVQGGAAPGSNATVTLSGDNSTTTVWSATKRKAWTTLTTASGTGSGTVTWTRNATGLAVGTYVDTISVTATGATGSPARVIDTLRVTAAPVPLALAVSPGSRNASIVQGGAAPGSNATVTLSGDNSTTTVWSASKRKAWTTLTTGLGTGSGTVTWSRNATGLAVGTYVDTISVTVTGATGSLARVIDTLRVTAAPVPLGLAVSPGSRSASVVRGGAAPGDNASVTLSGDNSTTTVWSATKRKAWTTLTTASGTGSGTVTWTRNATGLSVGTYVDTISVTVSGGSPSVVFDTLRVTAALVPLGLAVSPTGRSVSVMKGTSAPSDQATVTLSGDNSTTTRWSATKRQSWTTLTTASGTGSGTLAWSRNAAGLRVGTYVDTLTVTATGATGSPSVVYDTLRITKSISVTPRGKKSRLLTAAGSTTDFVSTVDSALVEGEAAPGTSDLWLASTQSSRLRLVIQSSQLNRYLVWDRVPVALTPGTYIDSITVTLQADPSMKAIFTDTLEVVAVQLPEPLSALDELFRAGNLSGDQRTLLDRAGNHNGSYDLGDFLAWVDRANIRLSASMASRLMQLTLPNPAAQPDSAAVARSRGGHQPSR